MIDETTEQGAKVIAFPELCITGYTCGDLFSQEILLREAKQGLYRIAEYTKEKDALIFVGVPYEVAGKLYNTAAALNHGKVLGLVTKTFLPNYGEFYEMRQFSGRTTVRTDDRDGRTQDSVWSEAALSGGDDEASRCICGNFARMCGLPYRQVSRQRLRVRH